MIDEAISIIDQRQNPIFFFQKLPSIMDYCQPYRVEKTKTTMVYKRS